MANNGSPLTNEPSDRGANALPNELSPHLVCPNDIFRSFVVYSKATWDPKLCYHVLF